MSQQAVPIEPHETLYLPLRRRFRREYETTPEGTRELRLFFGLKELTFDEPELFSFGETLIEQDQFMAGSATTWSSGEPHPWERVRQLLETLLAEDILSREPPKPPAGEGDQHRRFLAAEALRKAPTEPLWWNPDCPKVMERLTGRPLELGFLEAVLPVHRIAHPALDAEGRHVGEMNVFPDVMRMKLPTEWRPCPYPGSRYRDDAMMNVTALRSMTRHWTPVLQGTLAVREEFLRRHSLLPDGSWRVGDLHALACSVLALPTLLLMRGNEPVPNGALEPVLSSMFRVTDGVRMVMFTLLTSPELGATYDSPMTASELLRITERNGLLLSPRGVCAGPPHLMEEFLATLLEGRPVAGAPAPMARWEAELPLAVDYGLLGLQLYVLQYNLWKHMTPAYEVIRGALLEVEAEPGGVLDRLRAHVERDWENLVAIGLNEPELRDRLEAGRVEIYEHAQRGQRGFREDALLHLRDAFLPARDEVDAKARLRLRELIHSSVGSSSSAWRDVLDTVADAVAEFLAIERSMIAALEALQRQVNTLLQRPHPARRFSSADLSLHHVLRVGVIRVLPYLMDVLRDELGITVENMANLTRIEITNA
ncbi:hypothetical protein ATI61_12131 [Archangium gephyra]|uniref:Uncharacterized protein n=1 Tax=Archangium gephyra TaxID=48 RepID=A0AAC8Q151_9BACT|nr:hypothetical protein [Archangium gephyra]AKI98433.1 Hypothetical protein AA314_00060 [Archangium gephyra]REG20466.1 hypothetical protein ATI61_12131 [Archangium gephyra]